MFTSGFSDLVSVSSHFPNCEPNHFAHLHEKQCHDDRSCFSHIPFKRRKFGLLKALKCEGTLGSLLMSVEVAIAAETFGEIAAAVQVGHRGSGCLISRASQLGLERESVRSTRSLCRRRAFGPKPEIFLEDFLRGKEKPQLVDEPSRCSVPRCSFSTGAPKLFDSINRIGRMFTCF